MKRVALSWSTGVRRPGVERVRLLQVRRHVLCAGGVESDAGQLGGAMDMIAAAGPLAALNGRHTHCRSAAHRGPAARVYGPGSLRGAARVAPAHAQAPR